jgi:hypothetical protein
LSFLGPEFRSRKAEVELMQEESHEGEQVDAGALQALVKAAVAQNEPAAKKR